jgi:hypothetical protein
MVYGLVLNCAASRSAPSRLRSRRGDRAVVEPSKHGKCGVQRSGDRLSDRVSVSRATCSRTSNGKAGLESASCGGATEAAGEGVF